MWGGVNLRFWRLKYMIYQGKTVYVKVENKKRRKRITPERTIIHTKDSTISIQKYLRTEEISSIPEVKTIEWQYKGKTVARKSI